MIIWSRADILIWRNKSAELYIYHNLTRLDFISTDVTYTIAVKQQLVGIGCFLFIDGHFHQLLILFYKVRKNNQGLGLGTRLIYFVLHGIIKKELELRCSKSLKDLIIILYIIRYSKYSRVHCTIFWNTTSNSWCCSERSYQFISSKIDS